MSFGSTALSARIQLDAGQSRSVRKLATCPSACTPESVRPAPMTRYRGLADLMDGSFDGLLDRGVIGLALPPGVAGPIVFQD